MKLMKSLGKIIGVILTIIGLAGIPDNLQTWTNWLQYLDQNTVRTVLVVAGLLIFGYLQFGNRLLRKKSRKNKIPVKFTRSNSPYSVGEVAGFDRDMAERYVKAGVASYFRNRDQLIAWFRDLRRLGS